jgi:TM2 domain-containing membrane protein YozV
MKNKFYYIGLNFFIPGMGQLAAKRYIRGILQTVGSLAAFAWLLIVLFMPLIKFYQSSDMISGEIPQINLSAVLEPVFAFLLILLWSIIDLMFGAKEKGENKK